MALKDESPRPEDFPAPDDETVAAFALIDAAEWIGLALQGRYDDALAASQMADASVAVPALLRASAKVALIAGEYANDADETPTEAALRLLHGLREDFGRHGS